MCANERVVGPFSRDGSAHVRVRFQDYGFFLPTDATGAEAFIEGIVKVETLSEKTARALRIGVSQRRSRIGQGPTA